MCFLPLTRKSKPELAADGRRQTPMEKGDSAVGLKAMGNVTNGGA
jgi:hypothetical protein